MRILLQYFFSILLAMHIVCPSSSLASKVDYSYDPNGRLVHAVYDSGSISYTYDKIGNMLLKSSIDQRAAIADLNGDGSITMADAMIGLQILSGKEPVQSFVAPKGTLNGDGKITMGTVLYIMNNRYDKQY